MSSIWIRINGVHATEIASHDAPTWQTLADGGMGEARWQFSIAPHEHPPALRRGALVEILAGTHWLYSGRLWDWDRESGACVARGLSMDAYGIPALDGEGNATRNAAVAANTAITSWGWRVLGDITGTADGDSSEPMMVGDLLDLIASQRGHRWGQEPDARFYMRADPTEPQWVISPQDAVLGVSAEGTASHLVGRYEDSATATYETLIASDDYADFPNAEIVSLVERGALSEAQAVDILRNAMDATRARPAWTNGVTLHREQITTIGGTPAALESVSAGQMVRLTGIPSAYHVELQAPWLDVVIGKTEYTAGSESIYLEPVSVAPRTLTDVLAASLVGV